MQAAFFCISSKGRVLIVVGSWLSPIYVTITYWLGVFDIYLIVPTFAMLLQELPKYVPSSMSSYRIGCSIISHCV